MTDLAPEATAEAAYTPDLARLKKLVSEAREHTLDARRASQTDFDYYDNKQWTSAEIEVLRKRKQPEIWINRIAPAVDGILGVLEQGQTDPRAFPRNNDDSDAAEIATDALRYAAERSRWQRTRTATSKDYLVGGTGAVIVEVDDQLEVTPRAIRWEEFFYDPHSRDVDYADARYMGIAKWMYADALEAMYGLPEIDVRDLAGSLTTTDEQDEDKPESARGTRWGEMKSRRVFVVEMYHDDGGWKRCVFYGGGLLEYSDSPYHDEQGRPTCPIVAQSCRVDRDNQRYGVVRAMRPIQDEINMRRSRALHNMNSRRTRITSPEGMEVSIDTIRREANTPDGVLPYGVDAIPNDDMVSGQMALLTESKGELERMGPNPAVLGRQSADASGRAQLIRQQAGMIELQTTLGGIVDLELRVYRQMWCRARQFWTEPKWIRVTDDVGAPKHLMVNEPEMDPTTGQPAVQMVMDPQTGEPAMQPVVKNRPAEMDMDIMVDATPDTANVAAEQFAELLKLVPIYGPEAFPLEIVIKASSLPKKRELLEALEGKNQPQQPDPKAEAMFAAEMADKEATTAQRRSVALLNTAKTAGYLDPDATPSEGVMNPLAAMAQPMPEAPQPGF